MQKFLKQELLVVLFFVAVFIALRSINFTSHLNFSGDQAMFSTKALEIYRSREPVLIGPPISANLDGRQVFQGPMIYYEFILFLALGNFDPVVSSYLFMLFCAVMIIPLYYGAKMLFDRRAALILVAVYTLLPYYLDFTSFLWNPTFQFSLIPFLIYLMGLYKKNKNPWVFFGLSVLLGVMLQYHYQFVLAIVGLFIYYLRAFKLKLKQVSIYILGVIIGFSPVLLFELRNNFYNLQTLILFMQKWDDVAKPGGNNRSHYFLSLSFLTLVLILGSLRVYLNKLKEKQFSAYFFILAVIFVVWDLVIYSPKPATAFWSSSANWNYPAEQRVYEIIKKENLKDYNVTNLAYDTLALVPKYLMKRDSVQINYEDYYHEKYLFVVEDKNVKDFMEDPAYEVKTFRPFKLLKSWKINDFYNMYLVERGS